MEHRFKRKRTAAGTALWARFLLLLAATGVTLLFLEGALRIALPESPAAMLLRGADFHRLYFKADPIVGVVRRENLDLSFRFPERESGGIHFVTNNLGLRRTEQTSIRPAEGVRRVLILGDSQLDGAVDNEENASHLVEVQLEERSGAGSWEILNAATGSYSPFQSYLWYRTYGRRLEADSIVLGVFAGNDFAELLTEGRPHLVRTDGGFEEVLPDAAGGGYLDAMQVDERSGAGDRISYLLLNHFRLFALVRSFFSRSLPVASGPVEQAYAVCIGCTGQSLAQASWFKERGRLEESVAALEVLLQKFHDEVQDEGKRLLLLFIPSRLRIEPERDQRRIEQVAEILGLSQEEMEIESRFRDEIRRMAQVQEVPLLDLEAVIREESSGEVPLYYDTDWHLNRAGHRLLAEALGPFIEQGSGAGSK